MKRSLFAVWLHGGHPAGWRRLPAMFPWSMMLSDLTIYLIETVGVGQVELDIVDASDTVIVTIVPESGDVIQAMKAGLMEIADIFCLNKADREGADRIISELNHLLHISRSKSDWTYPVVATEAVNKKGIDLLIKSIHQHDDFVHESGLFKKRRKYQIKNDIISYIRQMLSANIEKKLQSTESYDSLLEDIFNRKTDPITTAQDIFKKHYSNL